MERNKENQVVIEFQKKIMKEAGCSTQTIAFLDEIEDEVFCEYYCLCFLDGMSIEEVRRIDSIPVQNWKDKIERIREERIKYLEKVFVPNSQMQQQVSELHEKAERVFKETEELRNTLNVTLKQTLKIQKEALVEQKESYQNILTTKEELLREKDSKIQSLLSELGESKAIWEEEKKTLLLELEDYRSDKSSDDVQKREQDIKINSGNNTEKKKKAWHFFHKDERKEEGSDDSGIFIETYLAKDTFNDAQKEFLIQCLEEGDNIEEMKKYASENLTPVMMQRLRQVIKKRKG